MAKKTSKTKTARPDFEQSLQKLEAIARDLEEGQIGLNDALARYEEGVGLLGQCHDLLEKAERRIELLGGVDADGNPITTPLEDDPTTLAEKARGRSRRRTASDVPPPSEAQDPEPGNTDVDSSGQLF